MKGLTKCLKALANERRLVIIKELASTEPMTVNGIAKRIKLSLKSTSKHIQKLSDCGLINRNQESLEVYCRLNRNHLILRFLIPHIRKH